MGGIQRHGQDLSALSSQTDTQRCMLPWAGGRPPPVQPQAGLQVAGLPLLRALKAAFEGAADVAATAPLLDGFCAGIRSAGRQTACSCACVCISAASDAACGHASCLLVCTPAHTLNEQRPSKHVHAYSVLPQVQPLVVPVASVMPMQTGLPAHTLTHWVPQPHPASDQ